MLVLFYGVWLLKNVCIEENNLWSLVGVINNIKLNFKQSGLGNIIKRKDLFFFVKRITTICKKNTQQKNRLQV